MSFTVYALGMTTVTLLYFFRQKVWTKGQRRDPIAIELRVCYWFVAALFIAAICLLIGTSL